MPTDLFKFNKRETLAERMARLKREQAQAALATQAKSVVEQAKPFEFAPADSAPDQIAIIFDDSSSMAGERIADAREGCIEFMRYSPVNFTAISIHPMNREVLPLTTNLPKLSVEVKAIEASGSTPFYRKIREALESNPKLKRIVAFSDGEPSDPNLEQAVTVEAMERHIPVDTVYIHSGLGNAKESHGYLCLKRISDKTGGYCIVYDKSKNQFSTIMKHLTSGARLALAADNAIASLEAGGKL